MRARRVIWNELATNFTHLYTVLHDRSFQSPCQQRGFGLFGVKVSENKGFLPVSPVRLVTNSRASFRNRETIVSQPGLHNPSFEIDFTEYYLIRTEKWTRINDQLRTRTASIVVITHVSISARCRVPLINHSCRTYTSVPLAS